MIKNFEPHKIVLDLRCLQDLHYVRRGVGRHALALLRHSPRPSDGIRLVGLVDPALPPLLDEARELVERTYAYAYEAVHEESARDLPASFITLSPMTHDPLFAARLLSDTRRLRAAVVYDFIPRRFPERYLPGPSQRLEYATMIRWLARCDIFAPISQSSADDLVELLGIARSSIAVTGAPLDPMFEGAREALREQRPRHFLVVGGGDPRKNPEVVVRAHARAAALQSGDGVPLLIGGGYPTAELGRFQALAVENGGRADLVELPGHVSDEELLESYGCAIAIVCPSFDEGFSLPVIEGMAAGVPCLVSDIPAHRELVVDPDQRFAPTDHAALSILMERALCDFAWRDLIAARQASLWPRFRSKEVGGRFWNAFMKRLGDRRAFSAPSVGRGKLARVALLSPLPPDRSGVADYTAATCVEFGKLVELHVFTETERPRALPGVSSIRPLNDLPCIMPTFDRVIGVVGNSHFHVRIFHMLRRFGGACIAHDARMLGFYRSFLGQEHALSVAARELGRSVSNAELNHWLSDEGKLEALFLGEIADSASPMIVHSPVTVEMVRERHGKAPAYLPFSIYRPWTAKELTADARETARRRLGIKVGEVTIATFGFMHTSKAPNECVWALDILRAWGIPASIHFVGGTTHMPGGGAGLRALAVKLGLSKHVHFAVDYVSEQTYRDFLVGADLGIQLRTYGLGGLSGALLDCAAAGLPTVTNESLATAVRLPTTYTRAIPDGISPLLLAEALANLLEDRVKAGETMRWEEARQSFSKERSFAAYARSLCNTLSIDVRMNFPTDTGIEKVA